MMRGGVGGNTGGAAKPNNPYVWASAESSGKGPPHWRATGSSIQWSTGDSGGAAPFERSQRR